MTTTLDRFPDHVAGEPYLLTREEFLQFAGLLEDFQAFLKVLQQKAAGGNLPGNGHNYEPVSQAFWATIASFEAMRRFQPETDYCASALAARTEDTLTPDENGYATHAPMLWQYKSTSGTFFSCIEYRQENEFDVLPEPKFLVTIPAYRDQPDRSHYEALRRGGTYCDF